MFKRRFKWWQLIIAGIAGILTQIITMIIAASKEGSLPALFGAIATIAITAWLDDTDGGRNTRKKNKTWIILTMASIFLTCGFVSQQSISLPLIIQLTLEFAFMVAMLVQTKYKPMP